MSAANGLSSGVGSGGGKMRRERTRFVASKPPEEEVGYMLIFLRFIKSFGVVVVRGVLEGWVLGETQHRNE